MGTRSALVSFPGYPFSLDALIPDELAATIAGRLIERGHETRIHDYGVLETVERVVPRGMGDLVRRLVDRFLEERPLAPLGTLAALLDLSRTDRAFRVLRRRLCVEAADAILTDLPLDFVAFHIKDRDDVEPAVHIASRLREKRSNVVLVTYGDFVTQQGQIRDSGKRVFDCACVAHAVDAVPSLADSIGHGRPWEGVPGIVGGSSGRCTCDSPSLGGVRWAPLHGYGPDVYPAVAERRKFALYTVNEEADPIDPVAREAEHVHFEKLSEQLASIREHCGATVFALHLADRTPARIMALASALRASSPDFIYCLTGCTSPLGPAEGAALASSGCRAVGFDVVTGSQRLHDRHYRSGWTITELEQALRSAKAAGLFTVARFAYPCIEDDRHTLAETLRLVDRTGPNAALVEASYRAGQSGNAASRVYPLLKSRSNHFPLPRGRWQAPAGRLGIRTPGQVVREKEFFAAELTRRGVTCGLTETDALIALFAGFERQERTFKRLVSRWFLTGDMASLASLVERFNQAVTRPAARRGTELPFKARSAVGG